MLDSVAILENDSCVCWANLLPTGANMNAGPIWMQGKNRVQDELIERSQWHLQA